MGNYFLLHFFNTGFGSMSLKLCVWNASYPWSQSSFPASQSAVHRSAVHQFFKEEKLCIRETLNLLMCADNSPNTKKSTKRKFKQKNPLSCVTFHVSCVCVTCCVSPFTCLLSLTPTGTPTDLPPANSPTMHSRLVCEDQQI